MTLNGEANAMRLVIDNYFYIYGKNFLNMTFGHFYLYTVISEGQNLYLQYLFRAFTS